ncbi:MAG: hypothetical protein M1820_003488 [Bogoriella megaspora]|nr:MAG: hypothetical protein M1820_003488 [Bogoriella megaspora]
MSCLQIRLLLSCSIGSHKYTNSASSRKPSTASSITLNCPEVRSPKQKEQQDRSHEVKILEEQALIPTTPKPHPTTAALPSSLITRGLPISSLATNRSRPDAQNFPIQAPDLAAKTVLLTHPTPSLINAFASTGARLVLLNSCSIHTPELKNIHTHYPSNRVPQIITIDITDCSTATAVLSALRLRLGADEDIDILVAGPGFLGHDCSADEHDAENWWAEFERSVRPAVDLIQAMAERMRERGSGTIVSVSGGVNEIRERQVERRTRVLSLSNVYRAADAAVKGLVEEMGREEGHGLRYLAVDLKNVDSQDELESTGEKREEQRMDLVARKIVTWCGKEGAQCLRNDLASDAEKVGCDDRKQRSGKLVELA